VWAIGYTCGSFGREDWGGKDHLKGISVDGVIILK